MLKRFLFLAGIGISLFLVWFAIGNYRAAGPIAEDNLRGLALSLVTAIENLASRDPSFQSLAEFHPSDIAFFAIIDARGIYRFHSNPDLIGTSAENGNYRQVLAKRSISEARVTLGTGEKAYEIYNPIFIAGTTYVLRLALHTYRTDAVVRRARFNMMVLIALLGAGWVLGIILYGYAGREERHRMDMARRERLARMGEMGAMLAHEIRNPLAGIKGYAQVIEKRPAEQRNAGFAGRIIAETLRLERLVSELLVFAGNESYRLTPVDIRELINSSVLLIRQEAAQQQVSLSIDCDREILVSGNRDKLGQVLLNIMKNALQAMPEGGNLNVAAYVSGGNAIIKVIDSGEGISADKLSRVFEPFFTTKARGTGIGLALCKKIIEEHKGKISVASAEGEGTAVTLVIPELKKRKRQGGNS